MKITVYPDKCVGVGQCVLAAPALFDQNEDDGIVVLLKQTLDTSDYDAARTAARLCPAVAIVIDEEG